MDHTKPPFRPYPYPTPPWFLGPWLSPSLAHCYPLFLRLPLTLPHATTLSSSPPLVRSSSSLHHFVFSPILTSLFAHVPLFFAPPWISISLSGPELSLPTTYLFAVQPSLFIARPPLRLGCCIASSKTNPQPLVGFLWLLAYFPFLLGIDGGSLNLVGILVWIIRVCIVFN